MDQVVFNLLASKQTSATSLTVLPPTPRLRCPPPAAEWAQTGSVRHCTAETGLGVGAKYLRDYEGMINENICYDPNHSEAKRADRFMATILCEAEFLLEIFGTP